MPTAPKNIDTTDINGMRQLCEPTNPEYIRQYVLEVCAIAGDHVLKDEALLIKLVMQEYRGNCNPCIVIHTINKIMDEKGILT